MERKLLEEIKLRLKAPIVVAQRIAEKKHVPAVFGKGALEELEKIQRIIRKIEK